MIKRILILVSVLIALGAGGAYAWWTTSGSGTASASVGTLTAPGAPTRTGTGSSVNLSWTAAVLSGGGTISYHLQRSSDPVTTWSDACGTTAGSGTIATNCTDTPAAGTYRYRATAIFNSWTAEGPVSDAFVAASTDTTRALGHDRPGERPGRSDKRLADPLHGRLQRARHRLRRRRRYAHAERRERRPRVVSEVAPNDGTTYDVAVSGMTGDGTVIASIAAASQRTPRATPTRPPSSTDNMVTYDDGPDDSRRR